MLLGHWTEMRSLAQISYALDSLFALLPDEAEHIDGDERFLLHPPTSDPSFCYTNSCKLIVLTEVLIR